MDSFPQPSSREVVQLQPKVSVPGVPVCPNGLNAMQYSDGEGVGKGGEEGK